VAGAIVLGAGPGIGLAVARRFAAAGMPITVLARAGKTVDAALEALPHALGLRADVTDEPGLRRALDTAVDRFGVPDVVVYNVGLIRRDTPGELSAAQLADTYRVNVGGAMTAAVHVAPGMAERGRGTILLTGGMPKPDPRVTSLSLGKAGVRALTRLLAEEYGPSGIHVATVTVGGPVEPGTRWDPDAVAEEYWRLHSQPPDQWEVEVEL